MTTASPYEHSPHEHSPHKQRADLETLDSRIPLVELQHASLMYGTVLGVNDIHLDLPRGAYALVGPNGAGKSTLIGLVTGSLSPTLGHVKVFGKDPRRSRQVMRQIGLCPAADLLVHGVTPRQWLKLQLQLIGLSTKQAIARVDETLEFVGLAEAQHRAINTFSLGMRQRCKLAQAISHDPELLILDEPFNGLDPIGRHQMTEMLIAWKNQGKSLLLASHVLHEVEQITQSFMLIFGGRLLASGTAGELRRLLADLPQDIILESPDRDRLASKLSGQPWVRALHRTAACNQLIITADRPLELYQCLAQWSNGEHPITIERLTGSDGDISTLFRLLVSKHRGERAYQLSGATS